MKINFRIYISIFSIKLSWVSKSGILYEESAGFVRDSKPIMIFPLDILKTVISKLVNFLFSG